MRTLIKSEGEVAVELSFPRIERTRSSGKVSNSSGPPAVVSENNVFCLLRLTICSWLAMMLLLLLFFLFLGPVFKQDLPKTPLYVHIAEGGRGTAGG